MGKGDLSGSPHNIPASVDETAGRVRSRHLSNGLTSQLDNTVFRISSNGAGPTKGYTIKHRITNGFHNICNNQLLYNCEPPKCLQKREKDKELTSRCRSYAALAIMLLANLINYMDRYTIAGLYSSVLLYYNVELTLVAECSVQQLTNLLAFCLKSTYIINLEIWVRPLSSIKHAFQDETFKWQSSRC